MDPEVPGQFCAWPDVCAWRTGGSPSTPGSCILSSDWIAKAPGRLVDMSYKSARWLAEEAGRLYVAERRHVVAGRLVVAGWHAVVRRHVVAGWHVVVRRHVVAGQLVVVRQHVVVADVRLIAADQ